MGIFTRKQPPPRSPGSPTGPRTIGQLYPDFYTAALRDAGKPITDGNVLALAGLTACNLALNADQWFDVIGDDGVRQEWAVRFNRPDAASDHDLVRIPDAMVDFLWQWDGRLHRVLGDFVSSMHDSAVSASRNHGDVLPRDMWSAA